MVKKRVKKSSVKRSLECKISSKSNLTYTIIAVLVLCALCLNFVEVGQGFNFTGNAVITGNAVGDSSSTRFIADLFASWETGNLDQNIAKYFLFGVLILLVFSALSFVKFPDSENMQWVLSVPIAFLSIAYLTPAELFLIITTFSGLGITLSIILPLAVMLFFSAMLLSNEKVKNMSAGKIILQVVLWGVYTLYLGYKLVAYVIDTAGEIEFSFVPVAMTITFIAALIILFKNKKFRKYIRELGNETREAQADAAASGVGAGNIVTAAVMGTSRQDQEQQAKEIMMDIGLAPRERNRKGHFNKKD